MKVCSKCNIEKPLIEFSKKKSMKDGYNYQCKECDRQYRIDNAEYIKQWKINNADKIRQNSNQWYKINVDYMRQYYHDNIEHIIQCKKQYAQSPQGKLVKKVAWHKSRDLLIANTPIGKHFTADDIIIKLKLQHYKCVYCETSIKGGYDIDHFIPAVKNGSNEAWNIQLLCKKCNRGVGGKGRKLPTEYALKHGKLF